MSEVVNIKGVILEKALKETQKGSHYYEISINNATEGTRTWRAFCSGDENLKTSCEGVHRNDIVEITGELKNGEFQGQPITYRNIKSIKAVGDASLGVVTNSEAKTGVPATNTPVSTITPQSNQFRAGIFAGQCFNAAVQLHLKELDKVEVIDMDNSIKRVIDVTKALFNAGKSTGFFELCKGDTNA